MGSFFRNMETGKIELHFDKSEYMALADEQKREIKSNFLFSRYSSAWISRAKFPNLYSAERVAHNLGLTDDGKQGERLTFEEQQERKAERAEARADRMEYRAEAAIKRGEALQAPIESMHGDIAFFTQPNINTSAGRAFTNRRNAMWSAWERGFEEFKKSDYYQSRAEAARNTAKQTRPTDRAFCQRRIDEAEKEIRACKRALDENNSILEQIEAGKTPVDRHGWETKRTREEIEAHNERLNEIAEQATEKAVYYQTCIDEIGGIQFSKENIKSGYTVKLNKWHGEIVKVISAGTKNIKYRSTASGFTLTASYAEIAEVIDATETTEILHPFKVGEEYTVKEWNGNEYAPKTYKVMKVTPDKVTVKSGNDRAKAIRPRQGCGNSADCWFLTITDGLNGYITKKAEQATA